MLKNNLFLYSLIFKIINNLTNIAKLKLIE
jgi:hypothetical protein